MSESAAFRIVSVPSRTGAASLAAAFMVLSALAGSAGAATIIGKVVAKDGTPVAGAKVTLSNRRITVTDAAGMWRFGRLLPTLPGSRVYLAYIDARRKGFVPRETLPIDLPRLESVARVRTVLEAGGTISGRVLDGKGVPVPGIKVNSGGYIQPPPATWWHDWEIARDVTDALGRYRLRGLVSGTHEIFFDGRARGFVSVLYPDIPCSGWLTLCGPGGTVAVTAPAEVRGVNVVLRRGAFVRGRVTGDGQPLAGVRVRATRVNGFDDGMRGPWGYAASGVTGSDGRYLVGPLLGGPHRVDFDGQRQGWIAESYDGRRAGGGAELFGDPVSVPAGGTVGGIDAALARGGAISGRVLNALGPLPGTEVFADSRDLDVSRSTSTGADGAYAVRALPSGVYTVFADRRGYAAKSWPNQVPPKFCGGDGVRVTAPGETAGVDLRLSRKGSISGRVTAGGSPLAGAQVRARFTGDPSYAYLAEEIIEDALTDGEGRYTVRNLPRGRYQVFFSHPEHASEWYPAKPLWVDAGVVTVAAGAGVTGVNADLGGGGSIAGRVTDGSGNPLAGYYVYVREFAGPASSFGIPDQDPVFDQREARTDADGRYQVDHVAAGAHSVLFAPPVFSGCRQWYDGVPPAPRSPATFCLASWNRPPAGATPVAVADGGVAAGIDATMQRTGSITGTVTFGGQPPGSRPVVITVYEEGGCWAWNLGATTVDPSGAYEVPLQPGRYVLEVAVEGGARVFYPGARTREGAQVLEVPSGAATAPKDVDVPRGGSISGVVSGPVRNAVVHAVDAERCRTTPPAGAPRGFPLPDFTDCTASQRTALVAADGSWRLDDMSGSHKIGVCFPDLGCDGVWQSRWLGGQGYGQSPTFTLLPGEEVAGVELEGFVPRGAISGHVQLLTSGGTAPCVWDEPDWQQGPKVEARLYTAAGVPLVVSDFFFLQDRAYLEGALLDYNRSFGYDFKGLAPGDYKVQFVPDPPWQPRFYANKPDLASADVVHVEAGTWVPGVDATLQQVP